ncbi:MAG: GNAT family N-acetyltransferase [Pseudomonadota bacterium]
MIAPTSHTTIEIPSFEEGRLIYRAPRLSDFEAYAAFRGSPRSKGVGGPYLRSSAFQSLAALIGHWHLRGFGRWMIEDRDTGAPLGIVGPMHPDGWPEPEIAWSVFEAAEGRGVAYEAARFSLRYAYEVLGWSTAISCSMPDNTRSIALAKRLGATYERDFVNPEFGTLQVWRHVGPEAWE